MEPLCLPISVSGHCGKTIKASRTCSGGAEFLWAVRPPSFECCWMAGRLDLAGGDVRFQWTRRGIF